MEDLGFASIFKDSMLELKRMPSHYLKYMTPLMLSVGANTIQLWTPVRVLVDPHGGIIETIHSRHTGIFPV